ncbi:MAG: hypothetical protein WDA75_08435 [Candidatus Latescibacterota bacterium]
MTRTSAGLALLLAIILVPLTRVQAQPPAAAGEEPRTRLEALQETTGAVVLKEFRRIARIRSSGGFGSVEVTAVELTDVATGRMQTGLAIEVAETGTLQNSSRSFVDLEEIEPLLLGLDYVARVTAADTRLGSFEASYTTGGHFSVSSFGDPGKRVTAAVRSGQTNPATVALSRKDLAKLRAAITSAREVLGEAGQP